MFTQCLLSEEMGYHNDTAKMKIGLSYQFGKQKLFINVFCESIKISNIQVGIANSSNNKAPVSTT